MVFIKIATEALTREEFSPISAELLSNLFQGALQQPGDGIGLGDLLWSPDEALPTRRWTSKGVQRSAEVSQFVHWYCALGDARNAIVHGEAVPALAYDEPRSPYNGPFSEIGDRVVREAVTVLLGECGFPTLWRQGLNRAAVETLLENEQKE